MKIDPLWVWNDIQAIKKNSPLIHNITNYVVMEQTANSLLAIGASPVMSHALEEAHEIVSIANSLVLNIGTLSSHWVEAMKIALKTAKDRIIPVVLDPVGVGATTYRTQTAVDILNQGGITAIRGNASEINTLSGNQGFSRGVDSRLESSDCIENTKNLASRRKCVVWMSGSTDVITDGKTCVLIYNGDPLMSKVTGMGCTASAISAAFLAINPNPLLACLHAAILMGITGEIAAERGRCPGTFKLAFIDALYTISLEDIKGRVRGRIL